MLSLPGSASSSVDLDTGRSAFEPDKSAYDELPDGVLVADMHGAVRVLNPAGTRMLGRSSDEVLGRDYREVMPLRDGNGRDWWVCTRPYDGLASRTRQPERRLTYGVGPGSCDLLVTAAYVRSEGPVVRLVVSFRDCAARAREERSRADLVSTVAHELRSPLTSVKGFTATLLAKWERFPDEQKKLMLQMVNSDADRVTRLLSELLDVSRIDAGRLEMRRQVVDVATAAQRAVDGRVADGEDPSRFTVSVTGELPEMWVDPDKCAQIFGNLLENAVRHGAGAVSVSIRAHAARSGVPTGVVVSVCDQGDGVPEETLSWVFKKFWRGGSRRGGTGLGLYIVKGLVEAHGGTITVGRAAGGGAEFRFTLPTATPDFVR